jgi:integrase
MQIFSVDHPEADPVRERAAGAHHRLCLPGAFRAPLSRRTALSWIQHQYPAANPVRLVRQSSARVKEPEVLTPDEIRALLKELDEPVRTIVHVKATTGIRRGELFGLKWMDLEVADKRLKIVRSIVDQEVGATKTNGSKRPLPISDDVLASLHRWREKTDYGKPADWIFASPQLAGEKPYWPNALMARHVLPAADRAGITKRIGWHTFRHTFATLLQASGAGVRVSQELLRHNSPILTLGTYTQAVTEDKRLAQARVAALFADPTTQEQSGTAA